jgi:hypothetical protein
MYCKQVTQTSIRFKWIKEIMFVVLVLSLMLLPILSFAVDVDGDLGDNSSGKIVNPINSDSLDGLIKTILEGALKIGIPLIALAIIYCGFLFVSARGNPESIKKAKDALIYTLIGAAILLGAWALALLIKNTVLAL